MRTETTVRVSEPTIAGTVGPMETWIDRLRAKVAQQRGVDPMSLEATVVHVGQEDGKDFIDVRFTSK